MMLTDSHAHVDGAEFDADRPEVLARARAAGVQRIVVIGAVSDPTSAERAVALAERDPDIWATVATHPHDVANMTPEWWAVHERLATRERGHWTAAELLEAATTAGHASLGFPDAGSIAADGAGALDPGPELGEHQCGPARGARRRDADLLHQLAALAFRDRLHGPYQHVQHVDSHAERPHLVRHPSSPTR